MNSLDVNDTIAAIASAPGHGLRGIVRITGPQTLQCLEAMFVPDNGPPLAQRRFVSAISGQATLSDSLLLPAELLWWPTKQSYTRQPTGEIHTIGSKPLLQMLITTICQSGARLAQPGEFTLRAFLSGRIDLTQAEAVLAVIDADGQNQFDTALQQLAGGLTGPLAEIRLRLMGVLAELEAGLDFVEEDIEFISQHALIQQLDSAALTLSKLIDQISNRDLAENSPKIVLSGLPNSGKSSLFNSLTKSQHAIVTPVAGTTTDFISAVVEFGPIPFELIDTAGVESQAASISQMAQVQRNRQLDQADALILCLDGCRDLNEWECGELANPPQPMIVAVTKSDLMVDRESIQSRIASAGYAGPVVFTSALQSTGLDELMNHMATLIFDSQSSLGDVVGTTVIRTSESIRESNASVRNALEAAQQQLGNEIVAAEIRQALECLGQVVGTIYTDDILDLVFGRFCIGK